MKNRLKATWPVDLALVARAWRWGRPGQRPALAPAPVPTPRRRRRRATPSPFRLLLLRQWSVELLGLDAVDGLEGPVVVASNHQSVLDLMILRSTLPLHWRISKQDPEPALAAGRSVIVFPEGEPGSDVRLGRFDDRAAELASLHNVPIVPVAISGTFNLKALLSLRNLAQRPVVRIRIGSPLHPRTRTIRGATQALRDAIADLQAEDTQTWWRAQVRASSAEAPASQMAAWRRMWGQTSRRDVQRRPGTIWREQ